MGWWNGIQAVNRFVQRCPPEVVWAMSEHGFISAANPEVTLIDLAGLHDRHTLTGTMSIRHILDQQPDVIWFPHEHYTGMTRALLSSNVLEQNYDFWPGAFTYGLAIRIRGRHREAIQPALEATWQECYRSTLPSPSRRLNPT
jgi:hypothetical protein